MQLIHLTYTWPTSDTAARKRIDEAFNSWRRFSDPEQYTCFALDPNGVKFHSQFIGDKQPYPILPMIISDAFRIRENDDAMVCFVNSDIRLIENTWSKIQVYVQHQMTHYEDCLHTREKKLGEAQSTPVTFFFSYRWWNENSKYIPPILFACPYWERPFQLIIDRTCFHHDYRPACTEHVPHDFWKPFNNWRTPARSYNAALAHGWEALRLDRPSFGRGLKYKS